MRLALGQVRSIPSDIEGNLERHLEQVEQASRNGCQAIFFPELSLTAYAENFAEESLFQEADARLEPFREVCERLQLVICVGIPLKTTAGVMISSAIFQPGEQPQIYSKQLLYVDEKKAFIPGDRQVIVSIDDSRLGLAICYESTQESHLKEVISTGADHYICMVAKTEAGILRTSSHYKSMSAKYSIPILMVNGVGPTVDFISGGGTCVWDKNGGRVLSMDSKEEGILFFDS